MDLDVKGKKISGKGVDEEADMPFKLKGYINKDKVLKFQKKFDTHSVFYWGKFKESKLTGKWGFAWNEPEDIFEVYLHISKDKTGKHDICMQKEWQVEF